MEFLLPDNNPWNNIIHLPDGRPVYHVETHIGIFSKGNTVIKRISGAKSAEMSVIDSHSSWDDNLVQVWGHDRAPRREGHISTSEAFTASDGRVYKWKNDWDCMTLLSEDGMCIATFEPGSFGLFSKPTPPKLVVSRVAEQITDEIITTWIYMQQRKRTRRKRRNRRAIMF